MGNSRGTSVAAGAFASHALKAQLSQRAIDIFETGAKYQMYHALALLAVALLFSRAKTVSRLLGVAGFAFIIGTALFSGSLYPTFRTLNCHIVRLATVSREID